MEPYKNLVVTCQTSDGAYLCTLDMYDVWTQQYDNVTYVARAGDPAPANIWILDQIATGAYDPISACLIPPSIDASFSPNPIFVSQTSTLTWNCVGADSVTLSDDIGTSYPSSGSKTYQPSSAGSVMITITAKSSAGTTRNTQSLRVVSTQAELDSAIAAPVAPVVM